MPTSPNALTFAEKQAGADVITTGQVSKAWVWGALGLLVLGGLFFSPPLFGVGIALCAALLVAWLWARWCLSNLTLERRFSHTRAFWGEEITVDHIFVNNKPLPVPWLAVSDEYPASLELLSGESSYAARPRTRAFSAVLSLGWYERVTRHYRFKAAARGEHEFGPLEIWSGDIFGLFRRAIRIVSPGILLVYPRYVPVERLGLPARQPFGDYRAAQQLLTDPLRLRAVREYAQGDNPRHIHWKATARRGELQTRLFDPSATPQLQVFLNQDTFAHIFEGLDPQTLELAITVAASVANHALEEGWMVGLQVNAFAPNSDRQVKLAPSRDPDQLTRILEALARLRGWSGLPVEDLLRAQRYSLSRGATLVVVTGILTSPLLDILLAIRRSGHPITLIEVAGSERAAQYAGRASATALRAQGITHYSVDAVGQVDTIPALTF